MKILGIDTTTKFLSVGIYDDGKVYEYNLETAKKLSLLLDVTLKRIIDALDWRIDDIDYFACGLGPGSFTGMRIGLAAMKGMSWALKKPIIGISSLDILASGAIKDAQKSETLIIPLLDAKRSLLYCSIYRLDNKRLKKITPYMLLGIDEFLKRFKKIRPKIRQIEVLGDGLDLCKEIILANIKGASILDKDYWRLNGRNIIKLALEKIKDKKISNPFDIKPIYLYPKECQIKISA